MAKRIAFLCNSMAKGGLEMNIARHAQWLAEAGHDVSLYTPPVSPASMMVSETKVKVFPYESRMKADVFSLLRLFRKIEGQLPDYLFIHHSGDINLGILLKSFFMPRLKVIYFQEMQIGVNKKDWLHTMQYRRLDAWISPLPGLGKNTQERTHIDPQKIHIIPLAIDMQRFLEVGQSQAEIRQALDLPLDVPLIGIIGRYDPHKGQEYLIKALAKIRDAGLEAEGLLLGEETRGEEGGYLPHLEHLVKELGLEDKVHFRPFLDAVEKAYYALDIFVMSTPNETYGMVTIEAMSCGLPVVGSNGGGTRELVQAEKTGLLFEPGDVDSLSESLKRLLRDPGYRQKLGEQARIEAQALYSHHQMVKQLEHLMDQL